MSSRGEADFVKFPPIAAKLYDRMMRTKATDRQYVEIAADLSSWVKAGRLLDIGTGPGRLLLEIHELNSEIHLFGLDISPAMVTLAQKALTGLEVDLKLGNIRHTDYPSDFFDLITCSGSFYLWDEPEEGLNEIYRILKPGKTALLYETHCDYDERKMRKAIAANLEGESPLRRIMMPRFLMQQLKMTYRQEDIVKIIEATKFSKDYKLEPIIISNLPIWLSIVLEKKAREERVYINVRS